VPKRKPAPSSSTFRWPKRVLTPGAAIKFIDAAGFCMLFPVKKVPLPSLYHAVTRRDLDAKFKWDRYAEMIWKWKSALPGRKRVFYGKYFRGRGTFISPKYLPYFLAMRETAAAPDDHGAFYANGRITENARAIWRALAEHGPLATLELRNIAKMDTKSGNVRFKRAMADLQCMLIVVHFGTEQETAAWASVRFELTCRAFPKETATARAIAPETARHHVAKKFRELCPDASPQQAALLFGWTKAEAEAALEGPAEPRIASSRPMRIILASSSPRRAEVLRNAGIKFEVRRTAIDETRRDEESAERYVRRLALEKARAAAEAEKNGGDSIIIGADTVVVNRGEILLKPVSPDDARRMLRALAGGMHEVFTGLAAIRMPQRIERMLVDVTRVYFSPLSEAELEAYIATGEPFDKAGAYGIQSIGGRYVTRVEGCYFNVMGMPLARLWGLLQELG
jgi:septum formation protein